MAFVVAGACAPDDETADGVTDVVAIESAPTKGTRAPERRAAARAARRHEVVRPSADLSTAIPQIRDAYVVCVTVPEQCDPASLVATGSPAAAWLDTHLDELVLWNLARAPVDDRISIRQLVHDLTDRATAKVCIVNDLPLVDRREPGDPNDDIPFVNPLLSIMAHWELQLTADGWRLFDVWPLGHFPESDTCEPPRG